MYKVIVRILITVTVAQFCFPQTDAVKIRVGLYNHIPDLGEDELQSYKELVEKGFASGSHTVEAVVDGNKYSPYGKLDEYLVNFDLIEIDTATLAQVAQKGLIKEVHDIYIPENMLPAAMEAVKINGVIYGYPTLACGNFLVGLSPADDKTCPLTGARKDYDSLKETLMKCSVKNYERLLGGKMNSESGWYLPFLYLDGYIDRHGPFSVARAIDDVTKGTVDEELCEKLSWFIKQCSSKDGNKCYDKETKENYITDEDMVLQAKKHCFCLDFLKR